VNELAVASEPAARAAPPRPAASRMVIAVVALAGVFLSLYMLMFKLGLIGDLSCGAGSCDRVQASPWAIFLGVPVPLWGVAGYGLVTALAIAGLQPALLGRRALSAALLVTTGAAFAFSMYLTWLEAFVINAWCRWCIASAIMASVIFLCALPEARHLRRHAP
jgi:uncharacterized membrane protein